MDPRNNQSTAWTALPEDFKNQVLKLLMDHFKAQSQKGQFSLDGRIYKTEILIRMGYLESGHIRPIQFDLSIDYDSEKSQALQHFETLIDLGASLLDTYFRDPQQEFPFQWQTVDFEGTEVFIRQETTNSELERQANELLGEDEVESESLIHGDLESDEIESIAESLNTPNKNKPH